MGWFKMWRYEGDCDFRDDPCLNHVWVLLLMGANWEGRTLRNGIWLEPGDQVIGRHLFAARSGISVKVLDRCLRDLRLRESITTEGTPKGTWVRIKNWLDYQRIPEGEEEGGVSPGDTKGYSKGYSKGDTEREVRSKKKKEVKKGQELFETDEPAKNGSFKPPTVDDVRGYCQEKGYGFDPEQFIAHNQARGWKLSRGLSMKCWKSACTTWHKNQGRFDGSRPSAQATRESETQAVLNRFRERHKDDGDNRSSDQIASNGSGNMANQAQRLIGGDLFAGDG